ncbi:MAG: FtsX-like permease family protein, partial [Candidatus Thorarchaeota archaeon]
PNSTVYGLDEPIYTYGLKDCEVILADDTFLDITASEFTVEGTFNIHEGEVLISQQFVTYVYEVFGLTMTINSSFGVEVLTQRPVGGDAAPIGELGRMSLESLKIVGIYEVEGFNSIVELGFPSLLRSSYENFNYDLPVLGIRDSIIIKAESLGSVEDTISEQGFFGARTFIRASGDALIDGGLDAISVNLLTLKARIDERYVVNVEGLEEIEHLQGLIDTYSETILLSLLNLPIFILALFLSVFAADTFMAARNTEVSALRSKGASSSQIYGIFIAESLLMAVMSLGLGLVLSIVFAALIPSTVSFMSFDFEVYSFYLSSTVLRPETILKAAHSEIGSYLMEVSEPIATEGEAHGFTIGASIALLVMVALSVLFLPTSPSMLLVELGLGTAAWFFLAYNELLLGFRSCLEKKTASLQEI